MESLRGQVQSPPTPPTSIQTRMVPRPVRSDILPAINACILCGDFSEVIGYTRDSRLWLYGGRQLRHGGRQLPVPCAAPDLNVLYVGFLSDTRYDDVVRECRWEVVPASGERPPPQDVEAMHYLPGRGGQARPVLIPAANGGTPHRACVMVPHMAH